MVRLTVETKGSSVGHRHLRCLSGQRNMVSEFGVLGVPLVAANRWMKEHRVVAVFLVAKKKKKVLENDYNQATKCVACTLTCNLCRHLTFCSPSQCYS